MTIRAIATKALTVTALSASLLGIAAGTASARPISEYMGDCKGTGYVWQTHYFYQGGQRYIFNYSCTYSVGGTQYRDYISYQGEYDATYRKQGGKWVFDHN